MRVAAFLPFEFWSRFQTAKNRMEQDKPGKRCMSILTIIIITLMASSHLHPVRSYDNDNDEDNNNNDNDRENTTLMIMKTCAEQWKLRGRYFSLTVWSAGVIVMFVGGKWTLNKSKDHESSEDEGDAHERHGDNIDLKMVLLAKAGPSWVDEVAQV